MKQISAASRHIPGENMSCHDIQLKSTVWTEHLQILCSGPQNAAVNLWR